MSIKRRAKSAVRRRAARASVALPAARGPEPWQHLVGRARVAEARRVLRAQHDPAGALALVQPLLDDPALRSRVWGLVAEAREKQGDRAGALAAARTAVDGADVDFTARVVHQRLAVRAGADGEAAEATARLVDTRPRNARETRVVLTALRTAGHPDVQRLRDNLERWDRRGWDQQLEELDAEIDLRAADDDGLEGELARVTDRLANPLPVVARVLDERRLWARLATYADDHPPAEPTVTARRAAALELRKAAARALTAGATAGGRAARRPRPGAAPRRHLRAGDLGQRRRPAPRGPRRLDRGRPCVRAALRGATGGGAVRAGAVAAAPVRRLRHPLPRRAHRARRARLGRRGGHPARLPLRPLAEGRRPHGAGVRRGRRHPLHADPRGRAAPLPAVPARLLRRPVRRRDPAARPPAPPGAAARVELPRERAGHPARRGPARRAVRLRDARARGPDEGLPRPVVRRLRPAPLPRHRRGRLVRGSRAGVRDHRGAQARDGRRAGCPRRSWWCCRTACTPRCSSRASGMPRSRRRWACAARP